MNADRARPWLLERGWEEVLAGLWIAPERDRSVGRAMAAASEGGKVKVKLTNRPRLYATSEAVERQRLLEGGRRRS